MNKINFWESQSLEGLNVSVSSRIALILCNKPALSRVLLILMFIIYQLEVFTIVLRPTAHSIKTEYGSEIFNNIYDDVFFGVLDTIADSSNKLLSILGCVLAYVILDILLVLYMAGTLYLGKNPHSSVEKICNSLAYIHHLILSFPIHVGCCQVLYALSKGQEMVLSSERSVLSAKALCILIIVINAIWSLTKILLFDINIKTKDPISSKTGVLTLFEFVFRLGMPIFEAFALPNGTLIYALLSVNLVCSLLRDYLLFYYLPYYKLPVLKIAAISHAVITSCAFAAILSRPIGESRSYSELDFFLPLAAICIIILGKLYTRYFNILTRTILQHPAGITNSYHLIHYLRVYKAYEKCSQPSALTTKVKESYFIYTSIVKQSEVSHLLPDQQYGKIDHKTQEMIDQHFVKYFLSLLNAAIKKNPKLSILKVTLAHLYMKFEKLYVLADQIADKSVQHSFGLKNSTSLIRMTIWEKLRSEISSQNDGAVQKHIHLQEMYKNLKLNVIDQLKKGVQFWKNFQEPDTDFYSLMNLASQVSKRSKDIKKSASYYDVFQEFNFAEPLLIYSLYFFFAQNDIINAQKFFKEYSKSKFKKVSTTSKGLKMLNFTTEALYFTLSTSQENFGVTLDCSGQALKTLGLPKEMIIKRQLSTIMPQFYVKWFEDFLKTSVVNSNFEKGNKAIEVPIMMQDGYITSHSLHITLNYTREFGLCFSGLLRPIKDNRRIVIIAKNGQILNVSQKFAEDINIEFHKDRNNKSIFNFCPSLEQIIINFTNENPYSARLSDRVNIEENKDPVENLLEIADEENNDTQIKENIFTKKVSLTFQPHLNTPSKLDLLSAPEIEYTAKIQLRTIQGISFFELSMEKTNFNMTQRLSFAKTSTVPTITKSLTIEIAKPAIQESSPKLEGLNPQSYLTLSPMRRRESKTTQNNEYFKLEALPSSVSVMTLKGANNMHYMETGTENPNNYTTPMSPVSEDQRFLVSPKGDTDIGIDDDIISEKKRTQAHKDFRSISFEKEVEKHDDKLALDFMSISDEDSSSILSGTKRIDAYKVTRKTIDSRAYQSSSHAYNLCFIVAILIQMTFLIWLNFFTSSVSNNVTTLSQVIQNTYFRSFWLKIVDNDALVLSAIRGGWYDYDLESVEYGVLSDLDSATNFNQGLEQYLSAVDEDIQALFYQKNVRIKERDTSGNLQLVSIDNTFEATNKIISYGLLSVDKPDQNYSGMDFLDYNTAFIADNSLNDFMIVSENLTSFVETKLANLFSDSKRTILGSLCASIVVLVLFILVSVIFVMHLNKDASHFMELIFTLPVDEVISTEHYLSAFQDLLERDSDSTEILDYLHTLNSKIQRKATHREITAGNVKKNRKIVHRASMSKFHARNYWILIGLFICLGLTIALMVVYYDLASNKIAVMKQQHTGLNSALSFLNIMAYVNPQAQVLTLWNGTSTIENIPSLQFIKDINAKLSIVTQFESTLRDTNGDIPVVQQNILFNYSCTDAYSPYYSWPLEVIEPECDSISNGLGKIGLISLVLQLQQRLDDIVTQFETSTRDEAFLEDFYEYVFNTVYYTDTGFVLLLQSYAYSLETFGSLVTELEDERVVLSWVAVVLSIAIGAITWIFIIRRLMRKEFQKKRMLVLIPNKLIFGSYLLTKYIAELK